MWQKCDNQLMIQAIRLRNVGVSFIGQISSAPKIFLLRKPQVVITTDVQQHGNWKNEILSAVFELYRSGNGVLLWDGRWWGTSKFVGLALVDDLL